MGNNIREMLPFIAAASLPFFDDPDGKLQYVGKVTLFQVYCLQLKQKGDRIII